MTWQDIWLNNMGFQKSTLRYLIKQGNERPELVSLLLLLLILMPVVNIKEKLVLPFCVSVILRAAPFSSSFPFVKLLKENDQMGST